LKIDAFTTGSVGLSVKLRRPVLQVHAAVAILFARLNVCIVDITLMCCH